jgi:hypothetical protein
MEGEWRVTKGLATLGTGLLWRLENLTGDGQKSSTAYSLSTLTWTGPYGSRRTIPRCSGRGDGWPLGIEVFSYDIAHVEGDLLWPTSPYASGME